MKYGKPVLLLDFDGVIHNYRGKWKGYSVVSDEPVPGAFDFIERALPHFNVQVHSTRSADEIGREAMKTWFELYDFDPDRLVFPRDKPIIFLTIDDRALCFDGKFDALDPVKLLEFRPWNRQGRR